ncbi:hypothetical protein HPP92_002137 [Vanilla planifolia]|uniref:Uncharacterized protein n=1 Tax=Vanilla planifolia TaxID=51239 RepID=A0A835S7Y6_VANPL|nr:hypothetical protein HPP92_002137 [Vanilla planifolia]
MIVHIRNLADAINALLMKDFICSRRLMSSHQLPRAGEQRAHHGQHNEQSRPLRAQPPALALHGWANYNETQKPTAEERDIYRSTESVFNVP